MKFFRFQPPPAIFDFLWTPCHPNRQWGMPVGRTVFAQLMDHIPPYEFHKCVERYRGNYKFRRFSCQDQFLCLAFAQLTFRESLRDIEACLRSVEGKLYHMGFRGRISRSTLADANEVHDWRIYADLAQVLINTARPMYANESLGFDLDNTVYALDSTTIDLCLSVFPWARFRSRKAAIKMHTLLDLRAVQVALASGVVLQMDQAAPANQEILRI